MNRTELCGKPRLVSFWGEQYHAGQTGNLRYRYREKDKISREWFRN